MISKVKTIYSFKTIQECVDKVLELGAYYAYERELADLIAKQCFVQIGSAKSTLIFFDPYQLLD
tara:strand:+ start:28459 stop:28650 length:192 start_codon:yes stop_codon:yes gene_type:complete